MTGYQRDGILNSDGTVSASFWNNTGIQYDNNGNRTQVTGSGANSYVINDLNQYTSDAVTGTMGYDPEGNLTSAAGWIYTYDAQNRLTRMETGGTAIVMTYDPLNRVVTRAVNGAITQNVWNGWNLIEEHRPDWTIQRCYLQGASQNEMVAAFDGGVYTTHWFWQDGRGNTSHITGDNAALLERYTYDLSGAPKFYDEWGNERFGGSVYDARFLFAGSQYLPETGLYDMRNRFYSPTLSRFLQTDPIGFAGDALNLYRYCGDDPVDRSDPMGLADQTLADRTWKMACFFDGGNSFNGSYNEFMGYRPQAGMGGGAGEGAAGGGGKSISAENEGGKREGPQGKQDYKDWRDAGVAGGRRAYEKVDKSGLGGAKSAEYGGLILKRMINGHVVYNYNGPFKGDQGSVKDRFRDMKRANYLDLNKLPVPGGWEKAGWYYAHPIPGNTIPNDDKELAREQGMVAVGLARQLRGSPGYNPSNPLIEFFPNN